MKKVFGDHFTELGFMAVLVCLSFVGSMSAGQSATAAGNANVPPLVNFSGVLSDLNGKPLTGAVGVTFSLYSGTEGGAPLWVETQNVQADKAGHYSVMLGSTTTQGLPTGLFSSGEARWLGVQAQGQPEQPRVLLVSVPYALKAVDAQTIGGLPPTAFVLAAPTNTGPTQESNGNSSPHSTLSLGGSGTANYVPLWTDNNGTLGNSALFQGGTAKQPKIGIGTTKPASALDVKGGGTIRGTLSLPATGTATTSAGKNSQPLDLAASAYNSNAGAALAQTFQWRTEPLGNDSNNPSGSLNLLFGSGSNVPTETGFNFSSSGLITFAPGQTFPGTGSGTITGVSAGTGLTGGGTAGNVTLSLDTTKVPELNTANTFTVTQAINGDILLPNTSSDGSQGVIEFGGNPFIHNYGPSSSYNAFFGHHAGNFSLTGTNLTAVGDFALVSNTSGSANTATGFKTLFSNTTGSGNTATGFSALFSNTSGQANTAVGNFTLYANTTGGANTANGYVALSSNTSGSDNTASGFQSLVSNTTGGSNTANGVQSLYSNTTGGSNTANGVNALFFTTTGSQNTATGASALASNSTGGNNTAGGYGALNTNTMGSFNTGLGYLAGQPLGDSYVTGSNNTFLGALANTGGANEATLTNATAIGANAEVTESNALILGSIAGINGAAANALVGIGTTAPTQSLEVDFGNALVRGANNFQNNGDTAKLFLGDTNNFIYSAVGTGITIGVYQVPNAITINQYSGNVGIGTTSPNNLLSVNGTADKPGGGSWGTFSDARLKTLHGSFNSGLSQILKLHPIRYRYRENNAMGIRDRDEHIGFVAQDVQRVIPEAVTEDSKGYLLINNDPILWTMLNAIKEQQREIAGLRVQLRMRPSSTATPAATRPAYSARNQELSTVRRQLNQLRDKDSRLEARLVRLEHALNAPRQQATVIAMASPKR